MTLVVAQRYSDGVRLVADTRLTEPLRDTPRVAPRTHYLEGALKVVILHRALCVGYAGPVVSAQVALQQVASTSRVDLSQDQVHALLASASRGGPDFVVATLTPQPGLAIIRDGAVHEGSNQAYVGDPQANDQFQKALDRIGGPGESAHGFGPVTRAMDEVITSNVVPTVGDLVTEVRCTDLGFRYTGHGIVSTGPFDLSDDSADPATWGSAAAGGYYDRRGAVCASRASARPFCASATVRLA
jgi:hypothetical protein